LIVFDAQGNSDTLLRENYIVVNGNPTAQFTVNQQNACANELLSFTDISTAGSGQITQWTWDLGNGTTSNLQNPQVRYQVSGLYPVSLSVTNQFGCQDDIIISNYVTVNAPDVSFNGDELLACGPPLVVNFTSDGTTSGLHFWDFGDGNTSTQINPTHTYLQNGSFDVRHIIQDAQGCRDTLIKDAYVNIGVNTLSVYSQDSSVCINDTVFFFTNAASNSQVFWDFGDGNVDSIHNPYHLFANPGIYQVTANISDQSGCTNTLSIPIEVFGYPTANFTVADTNKGCAVPFDVQFVNQSVGGVSYAWNFGDGNFSSLPNPPHQYTLADTFDVALWVTGPGGCLTKKTVYDYVLIKPLEAGFMAVPRGGCAPINVAFDDTTSSIFPITSWQWDLGNGNTSTLRNPFTTYSNVGVYDVNMIVENSQGCRDTVSRPSYIGAGTPPVIEFTVDTNIACALVELQFTNLTQGADSYIWYFGDGDTAMSENPVHGFAALGDVDVMLIASDRGCTDTLLKSDFVHILDPLPIIGLSDKKVCQVPQNVLFQNISIGDDYWTWTLQDSIVMTDNTFSYPITEEGTFRVSLTVGNLSTGCEVTAEDSILVVPVVADFSVDTNQGCVPHRVNFTNQSTNAINSWWYLGEGDTILSPNAAKTYLDSGFYSINLIVQNKLNCFDTIYRPNYIIANDIYADYITTTPTAGCLPLSVSFADRSGSTSNIVSWLWDFGDGSTSSLPNPTHVFDSAGYFSVRLTVTDANGCTHTLEREDDIFASQPIADFAVNPSVNCPDINSTFVTLSEGYGLSYLWSMGDGTSSYLANTLHAYADTGYYDVSLLVTDVNGCQDSITKLNHVEIRELLANIQVDTTYAPCPPLDVSFLSDTSYNHPNVSWFWDFGDGATSTSPYPNHVYTQPGVYDVTFIISSSVGCSDTIFYDDLIHIEGPKAEVAFDPSEGCPGTEFTFRAITQDSLQFEWLFGDGNTGQGLITSYTYSDPGVYTPILVLEDTLGCQVFTPADSTIEIFTPPTAAFTADQTVHCDTGKVTFIDLSSSPTSPIVSWLWDFGDGNTSSQQIAIHTYQTLGKYDVSLTVTTADGCSDVIVMSDFIELFPAPQPILNPLPGINGCEDFSINVNLDPNNHPYALQTWMWNAGDGSGNQPTGNGFSHTYTDAGSYTLSVVVSDENGCSAERLESITVHPLPEVSFTALDSMGCAPFTTSFSSNLNDGIIDWTWDLGDGSFATQTQFDHTYQDNGWYTVSLSVIDTNGCRNSLEKEAYIKLSVPLVDFSMSDTVICPGSTVNFFDQSLADTTLSSWEWTFGDGAVSNQSDPNHSYQQAGIYPIKLLVSDIFGCTDSLEKPYGIEVLRDEVPKVLALSSVSVVGSQTVRVDFPAYANVHNDFGAYVLYRKDVSGNFVEIMRENRLNVNQFEDIMAASQTGPVCYKVQVENHCGTTYDLDLAEEHCTIFLEAEGQVDEIVLNWTEYIGWDEVEQYNIYRVQNYHPNQMDWVGAVPGTQTYFHDQDMWCYDGFSYRIEALAAGSLQSFSDTAYASPIHFAPADSAHILRVSIESNEYVTVEWEIPEIERAAAVVIERDQGNGYKQHYQELSSGNKTKFLDNEVNVQAQSYAYQVFVVDSCGDYTQQGRRGISILLQASQQGNHVDLTWSPYQGWTYGVQSYTIEYYDPLLNEFVELAVVDGNTRSFTDDRLLGNQGQACYRVIAQESEGTRLNSISNEACARLDGLIITPTAFSPNADGKNDNFAVSGIFLDSYNIKIYNRWGVEVFNSQSIGDDWDGLNHQGESCPEGVYVFVATGVDFNGHSIERVGSVTLIR
ncbi:MAG: PKD domain-containing protein, partial [Bacteroidota bacterium]